MKANQKKTKAEISASVRDQKSPLLNYWINIKRRVKSSYRPTNAKASRSPPRRKYEDRYWQSDNFNATYSYPYFGPLMPIPWMPRYAHIDPYPSWDRYDTRAHSPSYFRPSHQYYAAPRRSTFEQSHVKDRFNHKESV